MVSFPIVNSIEIRGYGLYPGSGKESAGFKFDFLPGASFILGANGLGKATLLTMAYRMLTGPYDIPGINRQETLGSASLQPTKLSRTDLGYFAQRVHDKAVNAFATLVVRLGEDTFAITRWLADLSLRSFRCNETDLSLDESNFQEKMQTAAGVWSFGDYLLMLRHIVFLFEDRRALLWDASAQRQILRALLLPVELAEEWSKAERAILELDSRYRNLNAVVGKEQRSIENSKRKLEELPEIRVKLTGLQSLFQVDQERIIESERNLIDIALQRDRMRQSLYQLQQDRESAYRDYERIKLRAVQSVFPSESASAHYVIGQILAGTECLVCGTTVPDFARELDDRVKTHHCVICNSITESNTSAESPIRLSDRQIANSHRKVTRLDLELASTRTALDSFVSDYEENEKRLRELTTVQSKRSADIEKLIKQLPPEEAEIHRQSNALSTLRANLVSMRTELSDRRASFSRFVREQGDRISLLSSQIESVFWKYSTGFLFETCTLNWSPQRDRVGQGGPLIDFPAFELEMSGADFETLVRRSGPDQVSESQREFIDLAFRIALIQVAGTDGIGTIAIESPESSLDAVFLHKASQILGEFGDEDAGNRLVITSNVLETSLLPEVLKNSAEPATRELRILNLFSLAAPTAAVTQNRPEYESRVRHLIAAAMDSP